MFVTYAVAFVVALVLGTIRGSDHPRLHYWLRFDPVAVRVAQIPVAVFHGLAGLLVAGLAQHWNWVPLDSGAGRGWVNGAAYGVAAAALLRIEVTSFGLAHFSPARLLLRVSLEYFEGWIDVNTARAVARCLGDVQPRALCRVSWRLFCRHVKPNCEPVDAYQTGVWLRDFQITALGGDGTGTTAADVDAMRAQEHLRWFCDVLITGYRDATIDLSDVPRPRDGA